MADDELRSLVGLLDVDEPIVIVVRHDLPAHAERLLVALGCGWIVDPVNGVRCAKQCGHPECRMSIDERRGPANPREPGLISAGRIMAVGNGAPPWEPNLIDWRHSRVVAMKRAEADDDTLEICAHCECEVDTTPAPHRPGCPGIGKRASSATSTSRIVEANEQRRKPVSARTASGNAEPEGLDLLERMDAGDPLEPALGEVAAVGVRAESGETEEADLLRGGPERAAASPSAGLSPRATTQLAILEALAHGPLSVADVVEAVGKTRGTVEQTLSTMLKTSLVRRVSRGIYARADTAQEPQPAPAAAAAHEPQHWISVNGTGLRYRSAMDAYVAADEIEADGERVAKSARDDGNEGKADQAIDAARALAEKIRAAARAADGEPDTASGSTIDSEREPRDLDEPGGVVGAEASPTVGAATPPPSRPKKPKRSVAVRDAAPPDPGTPLTRFLAAKISRTDLEESVEGYRAAISELEQEMAIVQRALQLKAAE